MNLLVFNIRTDVDDTALGFTTAWVNALAARCSRVDLVTMRTGRLALAENVHVHSLDFDRRRGRIARAAAFYRALLAILRRRPVDACFAHMTPLLAVLFAPLARVRRIPVLLWYAHGAVSLTLRLADALVDRAVTSTPAGYRISSSKVHHVNQGIDTRRFTFRERPDAAYSRTAVLVGRVAPVKHVDEVIEAIGIARSQGSDLRLEVIGGPITADDEAYVSRLERLVEERGLGHYVHLRGAVPYSEVPATYHEGLLFPSLSGSGSLDKALLEAMASGCIPLSRNDAFRAYAAERGLEALVPDAGAAGLARKMMWAASLPEREVEDLRRRLRALVEQDHGLDALADRLMGHLRELAAS
jgi:glycosyltransferase involved in cell wall biosynthesis